tara:strand:- start:2075 stop:3244 length:1170 start_codon:yes stop_codon:yes gene_type:complete
MLGKSNLGYVVFLLSFIFSTLSSQEKNTDSILMLNEYMYEKINNQHKAFYFNQMTQDQLKFKTISKQKKESDLRLKHKVQELNQQKTYEAQANTQQEPLLIQQIESVIKPENEDLEANYSPLRLRGPNQFDSRIEIAELNPDITWQLAIGAISESVAMIVEKNQLIKISNNSYILNTITTLGNRYKLCKNESFVNQMVIGAGTAFIINKNEMITAAHVFQKPLNHYAIVFGYRTINKLGTAEISIPSNDVYFIDKIEEEENSFDITIFSVDRKFNRPILDWETSSLLKKGDEIYMLGYPMGLPQKLSINADITDNTPLQYFFSSLDGFQGNSGSPVFNLKTNKVIGVLVSGMIDYVLYGDCYRTTLCQMPYCEGEKAIRIEKIVKRFKL